MKHSQELFDDLDDPLKFIRFLWPSTRLAAKQVDSILSVKNNIETVVVAANMVGKDYVAGLINLGAFLNPKAFLLAEGEPLPKDYRVRLVTTSVADHHLKVLWGEIDRFINTAAYPLKVEDGGPLRYVHQEIRRVCRGVEEKDSYLIGRVSKAGEGLAGHHGGYTLFTADEASGVPDLSYDHAQGWAKRFLIFGNPNACSNFFFKAVRGGDIPWGGKPVEGQMARQR